MSGVIGRVHDIYLVGGRVNLDRGRVVYWLEVVRKLEEKLGRLREVLDLGGQGRRGEVSDGGELDREAVGEEVMYKGDSFWAGESYEEGELILTRRHESSGTVGTLRNCFFC
jgi:hypothetical protein